MPVAVTDHGAPFGFFLVDDLAPMWEISDSQASGFQPTISNLYLKARKSAGGNQAMTLNPL